MTPGVAYLIAAAGVATGIVGLSCAWIARRDYHRTVTLERRAQLLVKDSIDRQASARVERELAVRLREDAAKWNRETLGHMMPEEWGK